MAMPVESESMVKAVGKLDDMFQSTEAELSNLEMKLDVECSNMFDDQNSVTNQLRNPVKIMKRIAEVKADYVKIKDDVVEIQKLQLESLAELKCELDKMMSSLSSLDNKVLQNEADSESVDVERRLLALLEHMADTTSSKVTAAASSDNAATTSSHSSTTG